MSSQSPDRPMPKKRKVERYGYIRLVYDVDDIGIPDPKQRYKRDNNDWEQSLKE